MKAIPLAAILLLVAVVVAGISGCGNPSNTVSVSGRISYQGNPLTNGAVTFFPQSGRPVIESISATGDYTAELPPGEYTVVINVAADRPAAYKEGDIVPPPKFVLPDQYTTRAKSTLKATVAPGQAEPINFELK